MSKSCISCAICVLLMPLSAEGQKCPENAYEIGRTETNKEIRLDCRCAPGFVYRNGECERVIPDTALDQGTPLLAVEAKGDVNAYLVADGKRYPVTPDAAIVANVFVTKQNGSLVLQLPGGKRITIGPDSDLILGPPLAEHDLNILAGSGWFRFDKPDDKSSHDKISEISSRAFGRARAWVRRTMNRRFRVRTTHSSAGVRGTDFIMKADGNGGFEFSVLEGSIDLTPDKTGQPIALMAGNRARVTASGNVKRLDSHTAAQIRTRWEQQTDIVNIPLFGSEKK